MKKLSLIIPIYNCEEFLEECFDSILHQTIKQKDIEVILINDGTKDNSAIICQKYAEKYNWVFINRKENHGLAYTRNEGIDNSTADYIVFLDSDDALYDYSLDKLYDNIQKYNSDIAISKINSFNSKGQYGYYSDKYLNKEVCLNINNNKKIINCISACGKIYKKSVLKNIRFLENTYHEDNSFSLNALLNAKKISILPEYTYLRRIREGDNKSIMQNLNVRTFNDLLKNFKYVKSNRNQKETFLNNFMFRKSLNYIVMNISKKEQKKCIKEFNKFKQYVFEKDEYNVLKQFFVNLKYNIYYFLGSVYKFIKNR